MPSARDLMWKGTFSIMHTKKILSVLVVALCATIAFAVPNNNSAAATVNLIRNEVITNAELNAQMQSLGASEDQALAVLNIMINDEVFLQGAERDGVTVTDAQKDALYSQQKASYIQQSGGTVTDGQFDQMAIQSYGSVDAYKEALGNQYILQTYLMQERGDALNSRSYAPSAQEVETFYRRNATSFTQAENVLFAQVYIGKTGDSATDEANKAMLQGVADQIQAGTLTFEAAVNQYSEDEESKASGGVMGWLSSDNTVVRQLWGDDFVDSVIAMPLGQVSECIESAAGYHIVRVNVHNDARLLGIDDRIQPDVDYTVRDYITEYLSQVNMQTAMNEELNDMVNELRSEARIRIVYGN